jgi:3-oxoacyl-[acyl-carrier protein] reductase
MTEQVFAGRTALVTGAGRNIGAVIARTLARRGATVAVHYSTSVDEAAAVLKTIEEEGGQAFGIRAALDTVDGIDGLVHDLRTQLAARRQNGLDILVNNAARIMEGGDNIRDIGEADFDRLIASNMKAPFFLVQRLLPLLKDGGRVVNLSSRPSTIGFPQNITYAASKAALNALTKSLARELGPRGITVNAIGPGVIETDRTVPRMLNTPEARAFIAGTTALKRIGTAADVADVVAFLASDDARWITGAYIETAGGAGL